MAVPVLVLASASPARRKLLNMVGIDPIVCPSKFDESSITLESPADLVQALALEKAKVVRQQLMQPSGCTIPDTSDALILGCDSVLWVNGEIQGKPATQAEAIARWQKMRGTSGELYTGHAFVDPYRHKTLVRCQVTQVDFAVVSDRQIEAYVATGEPMNCAGGFALEGKGGAFVERIKGCHSNVIGLSLPLLRQMLSDLGYDVSDFWR
ncbi:MAG: nucleoside triphosphate pyrophosphatase [Leptolyngbyaceae bacterium]|nr:nucleoside triphosphate pyrophosphatase [Leptolyngbyaceae bacterium]